MLGLSVVGTLDVFYLPIGITEVNPSDLPSPYLNAKKVTDVGIGKVVEYASLFFL
jgi:hypothetical protein